MFLLFLDATIFGNRVVENIGGMLPSNARDFIPYSPKIGAWLSGAFLVNRIVDAAIWELLVARGTNTRVPKLLRQLSAIVIYGRVIACIIGAVFDQSVTTSSAVGLLIGLLRSLILDAFSGIAINLEQPFRAGAFHPDCRTRQASTDGCEISS